jgi:hypothetical protein
MRNYLVSFVSSKDEQGFDVLLFPTIIYSNLKNPTTPNTIWIMWLMWGIEIKISKY